MLEKNYKTKVESAHQLHCVFIASHDPNVTIILTVEKYKHNKL